MCQELAQMMEHTGRKICVVPEFMGSLTTHAYCLLHSNNQSTSKTEFRVFNGHIRAQNTDS